jgi:AcrR family transcriptional regulator
MNGSMPPRRRLRRTRPRIRLDTDERRSQLLQLGMTIFSDHTYDEVSIEDFARKAGISKGLLYHYFPTKRDLYLAGLRHIAGELLGQMDIEKMKPEATPLERVRLGIDAYLSFVKQRARSFVALMRGGIGSDPEVSAIVEGVRSELVERMFTGTHSPLAGRDHRTPLARNVLRGWLGFAEAASLDWLTHGDVSQEAVRDLLVDMLLPTIKRALGLPLTEQW